MSEPGTETPRTCARCNREIAEGQRVEHRGAAYCTDCVGAVLNGEASRWSSLKADFQTAGQETLAWFAVRSDSGPRSATRAFLLSLLPGVGQMYNGQLRKGVAVLAVFLWLATGGWEGFLGPAIHVAAIVALYFWNLFDVYTTAQWINRGEMGMAMPVAEQPRPHPASPPPMEVPLIRPPTPVVQPPTVRPPRTREPSRATPAWGVLLIVLGILFLINNYGVAWLTWDRLWPAALLALGIWLLISYVLSRRPPPSPKPPSQEEEHG